MRPLPVMLVLTLATNLVLGAFVGRRLSAARDHDSAPGATAGANHPDPRVAAEPRGGARPPGDAKQSAASGAWEQLNAGGPAQLAANLRAAGFQPQVVHAIIGAMVSEDFAPRRYALEFGEPDTPYWRQAPAFLDHTARLSALARLGEEQDRRMRALLGDDYHLQDEMMVADMKRRFGNLTPEKLVQVQALTADFSPQLTITRPTPGQPFPPPASERPLDLSPEKQAQLAALLTPEELRELNVRKSAVASALRGIPGFEATEAEFRALHEILSTSNAGAPNGRPRQLDSPAIQAALSPERYLDYKQAAAPEHAAVNRLVARLGQPLAVARELVTIRTEAVAQTLPLRADPSLTADQRAARLTAIADAAAKRIGGVLGPRGLEAYRQTSGGWLQNPASLMPSR